MATAQDGPPLFRPVPRRPFGINLTGATPPDGEDDPSPPTPERGASGTLNLESLNSRLLDPNLNKADSDTISRAQSVINLTSSTLMGIYTPNTYGKDRFYVDQDGSSTPWGTGCETPSRTANVDVSNYNIQQQRAHLLRRRSSLHQPPRPPPVPTSKIVLHVGLRSLLLSALGILYGILVEQMRDRRHAEVVSGDALTNVTSYDWRYLAFWGLASVAIGTCLPWFDGIWEDAFGQGDTAVESEDDHGVGGEDEDKEPSLYSDWALAVRGVGTFIGIAFAIRKLPWDSTLQVSLALLCVNPALWFLIDRSMPGLVMASGVGLGGAALLLGLQPDMVPVPANAAAAALGLYDLDQGNATVKSADDYDAGTDSLLGGFASQKTIEAGIWMLSILFCCCICFGNIGRRLALNGSPATKRQWSERR